MVRLLRWLAIVFLAVVLMLAAGYVAHGIHGSADVTKAKRRAVADLAEALPGKKRQALADRDGVRTAYVDAWGRPAYAWQELACELDTVEAGWIVEDYTQECRIVSVDLVPTATPPSDRCQDLPLPAPLPAAGTSPGAGAEVRSGGDINIGPASAFDDDHPYRFGCPGGILQPQRYLTSRMLNGSRPARLDASPAWIVVTVTTTVTSSHLGCSPWDPLFCDAPVDHPVMGEVG